MIDYFKNIIFPAPLPYFFLLKINHSICKIHINKSISLTNSIANFQKARMKNE